MPDNSKAILDVAYATTIDTLEDYLKTDICSGRSIYCAFEFNKSWTAWLRLMVKRKGIHSIQFRDGSVVSYEQ